MAHHGTELLDLARSRGLEVRFEASVAGGIPVLRALQEGLAGDRLVEVRGILNGTCAYILSRMQSETDLVRRRARRGADRPATPRRIRARTSTAPTPPRSSRSSPPSVCGVRCASATSRPDRSGRSSRSTSNTRASSGCTIRQIARASAEDNGAVFAAVRPALVPLSSSFGRVEGSQNLVTVRGVFGGETSFSGSGAGGSPTAVAVVSDVLSVRRRAATSGRRRRRRRRRSTGQRRLRRAALRPLHRQRQARHPGPGHRRVRASTASTSKACCSCRSSARIACRSSRRSRSARSRCSIARWPRSRRATTTSSRRSRCRSSALTHDEAPAHSARWSRPKAT